MSSPIWRFGSSSLSLGTRPLVMGVVNITPDSFSDGGSYLDPQKAVEHGLLLQQQGADILDIGGESTRPGSEAVPADEEASRVIPVIKHLRASLPDILLSVDTSKASVAKQAVEAGADIVNDVTAGRGDPEMFNTVANTRAGYILMHMQGTPGSMQKNPEYRNVVKEVFDFLAEHLTAAVQAGIPKERLAVDPGIGFGKSLDHNLTLLSHLSSFSELGCPLLLGVSRKRWIGDLTGKPVDQRLAGSLAGAAACVERGAHILRVHDVAETKDVVRILDAIKRAGKGEDTF